MDLEKILNASFLEQTLPTVLPRPINAKNSKGKTKATDEIGSSTERAARYDMVYVIFNDASGLAFGQILQGDTVTVQNDL